MKKILVLTVILIYGAACRQKDTNSEATNLLLKLNHENSLSSFDRVIVIPGEGCPGCISDAADFAGRNIDSMPNTMVVFTRILDKKLLRMKLKREFLTHNHVRIDSTNLLDRSDLLGAYPVVLYLKKGEISKTIPFDKGMFAPLQ